MVLPQDGEGGGGFGASFGLGSGEEGSFCCSGKDSSWGQDQEVSCRITCSWSSTASMASTQNLLAAAKGAVSLHSLSCQQRGDTECVCVCVNALAVDDMGCTRPRKLLPVSHMLGFAWLP